MATSRMEEARGRKTFAARSLARIALAFGVLAALCVSMPTTAVAQIGLGEVLETQNIRNEMAGGGRNNRNNPGAANANANANANAAQAAPVASAIKGRDQWDDQHSILRNKSASAGWPKLLAMVGLLLVWTRSADWINRDAQVFDLGYGLWNPVAVFPFVAAFAAAFLIPNFIVSAVLLVLTWLIPFTVYAVKHNSSVDSHEKIFTPSWFRYQAASAGKLVGLKIKAEKTPSYMKGAQVDLVAMGGEDHREDHASLITARQSPGYILVKELIADMADRRIAHTVLDYGSEAVTVRNQIDGVWHQGEPRDRESADVMLAVMKQLATLDRKERRKKQEGAFGAEYEKVKYAIPLTTQGSKTGERVDVALRGGNLKEMQSYDDLGMREKLSDAWKEVMLIDSGVIVFSALPEGGLTTLVDVSLSETDRLMRDFFSIEDKQEPDREFENVERHYYDSAAGESPATLVPQLSLRYPNVYVCRDMVNEESAKLLIKEVTEEERLLITTTHAREAAEALLRILQKKAPHKEFASSVTAVLNTRLIRLLCPECKVAFEPTPDLLKKLGIPAGKIKTLYREPKADEIDKPCKECDGLLFKGRTGLFELLVVNDQVREVLLKKPKLELLRKACRSAGTRTLQEEGILLVAKGQTSVSELSRALKA